MVENGTTIGGISPQERGEVVDGNSRLGELLAKVTSNWKVKCLLVPTLLVVATISRASETPRLRSNDVCFNNWELIGCAPWGEESFSGGPGSDDCSVVVVKQDGEFCVWSGPKEAPNPFEKN